MFFSYRSDNTFIFRRIVDRYDGIRTWRDRNRIPSTIRRPPVRVIIIIRPKHRPRRQPQRPPRDDHQLPREREISRAPPPRPRFFLLSYRPLTPDGRGIMRGGYRARDRPIRCPLRRIVVSATTTMAIHKTPTDYDAVELLDPVLVIGQ